VQVFGCFAEKDRKGILGKIKDFVYDKAGWQVQTPPPGGKNALPASDLCDPNVETERLCLGG